MRFGKLLSIFSQAEEKRLFKLNLTVKVIG